MSRFLIAHMYMCCLAVAASAQAPCCPNMDCDTRVVAVGVFEADSVHVRGIRILISESRVRVEAIGVREDGNVVRSYEVPIREEWMHAFPFLRAKLDRTAWPSLVQRGDQHPITREGVCISAESTHIRYRCYDDVNSASLQEKDAFLTAYDIYGRATSEYGDMFGGATADWFERGWFKNGIDIEYVD